MRKTLFILLLTILSITNAKSQEWFYTFQGIDSIHDVSRVFDLYNDGDSILYFGGAFPSINNIEANGIASWHCDTIVRYMVGVSIGGVSAITKYKDTLYIGGDFTDASEQPNTTNMAVWNGSNWQMAEIGKPDSFVYDFCVYRDTLYICGDFGSFSYTEYYKVAAYKDGHGINIGNMGMWTRALAVMNGDLYAGGYYGLRRHISGTEWETLPIQTNGTVRDLITDTINTFLYVGGDFTEVGGELSYGNAMWDGFKWNYHGDYCTLATMYQGLSIYRGDLYVSGRHIIEGEDVNISIDRWDGEQWDSIGGYFNSTIMCLEVFRDTLIIGGYFTYSNEQRAYGLAKLYMPENGCNYLKPRINTYADTFYLEGGEVDVNLYNNNPYADTWEWTFGDTQTGDVKDPIHTYTQVGEYNVQVTVTQNGCVKSAEKTIYIELGNEIPEFRQIDMQVFPNPSSHDFTVKTNLPHYKNAEIKIAGLNGHLKDIIPVNGETTVIPTKGWKPGTYVCNLFIDGKLVKTEKLIFQNKTR